MLKKMKETGEVEIVVSDFVLTNHIVLVLRKVKASFPKMTWEKIGMFFKSHLNLEKAPSSNVVQHSFSTVSIKNNDFRSKKKGNEQYLFLSEVFSLKTLSLFNSECAVDDHVVDNVDDNILNKLNKSLVDLTCSFHDLKKNVDALAEANLSKDLELKKEKRHFNVSESSFNKQQKEYEKVCFDLKEKRALLSSSDVRNENKREKRKVEKIEELEKEKNMLSAKVKELGKKMEELKVSLRNEKRKVNYHKKN